jgi:hypothetical protein
MGLIHEKKESKKSRATVPLKYASWPLICGRILTQYSNVVYLKDCPAKSKGGQAIHKTICLGFGHGRPAMVLPEMLPPF